MLAVVLKSWFDILHNLSARNLKEFCHEIEMKYLHAVTVTCLRERSELQSYPV